MKEKISSLKFHNLFLSTLRCRTSQDCGVDQSILASRVMQVLSMAGIDGMDGVSLYLFKIC